MARQTLRVNQSHNVRFRETQVYGRLRKRHHFARIVERLESRIVRQGGLGAKSLELVTEGQTSSAGTPRHGDLAAGRLGQGTARVMKEGP
jgi:hypothetical protein